MSEYVPPTEQLVTEILVRDVRRSTEFYVRLGFRLLRYYGLRDFTISDPDGLGVRFASRLERR
jgi:catechol 2,3-dioxygenase-like lactoylglutathione lyase family enzyme